MAKLRSFTLPEKKNVKKNEYEVREDAKDLARLIKDKKLWRYEYDVQDVYEPYDVITRAKDKLGDFPYSAFHNNCAHFVHWCKLKRGNTFKTIKLACALDDTPSELEKCC